MTTQVVLNDSTPVYLEVGTKRVFAAALAWPGWCRSGKNEEQALNALTTCAARYAVVAREAGLAFPGTQAATFHVVERLPGTVATDFGAPGEIATRDRDPLTVEEAALLAALVQAAWVVFDRVAAASLAALRKGPRGGGRDRDQVIDHVLAAEVSYARKLGVKHRQPARDDVRAVAALRRYAARIDRVATALRRPPHRLARPRPCVGDGRPERSGALIRTLHVGCGRRTVRSVAGSGSSPPRPLGRQFYTGMCEIAWRPVGQGSGAHNEEAILSM